MFLASHQTHTLPETQLIESPDTTSELESGWNCTSITGIHHYLEQQYASRATVYNAGPGLGITSFVYDYLSGITTVTTGNTASGVLAGKVLKFVGADQPHTTVTSESLRSLVSTTFTTTTVNDRHYVAGHRLYHSVL